MQENREREREKNVSAVNNTRQYRATKIEWTSPVEADKSVQYSFAKGVLDPLRVDFSLHVKVRKKGEIKNWETKQ